MKIFLTVLGIIAIVIAAIFVLSLIVYFFNLDMKLLSKMEPILDKVYDKRKREHKV